MREVVLDESDKAIVRTIIALAHGLKLNVIAEGVETDAQRQFLDSAGCHHYQGYLFGKPVSIEQFELFLKQSWISVLACELMFEKGPASFPAGPNYFNSY